MIKHLLQTLRKINIPQKGNYLISQEENGEIIILHFIFFETMNLIIKNFN